MEKESTQNKEIRISRVEKVEASEELARLFRELSGAPAATSGSEAAGGGKAKAPDTERINALIAEGRLAFYVVTVAASGSEANAPDSNGRRGEGAAVPRLAGMASVVPYRTAVSDKLWIEDVCILGEFRGLGLGRKLMEFVLEDAPAVFGAGEFWLTSRPSRVAARQLYRSLGFAEYETGVFRRPSKA